jgi:hypothetical protein
VEIFGQERWHLKDLPPSWYDFTDREVEMPDDKLMKLALGELAVFKPLPYLEAIEQASRAMRPLLAFQENSAILEMLKTMEHQEAMTRTALELPDNLRGIGVVTPNIDSLLLRETESMRLAMADLSRFRLPEIEETASLIANLGVGQDHLDALMKYSELGPSLQRAMDSMRTPWLDTFNTVNSVAAFAELQTIGDVLGRMPAFDDVLVSALRANLGDWRDRIKWPQEIFTDLGARSDFYTNLGFNQALTDFPIPAFEESLRIAGLRHEPPPLVERYGTPVPRSIDKDEEESFARTNIAHNWLLRLETQLRQFIDEKMTRAYGSDWPKHRLPKGLYEKWQEKKRISQRNGGREWPLVAYADFTDYELVICKRDNWREVFTPFFDRQESVRESFQRLYPVRLDTMHARSITPDDELLLYVETKRLIKVIIMH